jgi:fructose/tagatose bisphosphate aldolase
VQRSTEHVPLHPSSAGKFRHRRLGAPARGFLMWAPVVPLCVASHGRAGLDIERIKAIKDATGVFMTLHGGSGTSDADFVSAIQAGITIVHVNTELRLAWRRGLETALAMHPDEVAPYKLLPVAAEAIQTVVTRRLRLFNAQA